MWRQSPNFWDWRNPCKIWFTFIEVGLDYFHAKISGLMLELSMAFCLTQHSTQVPSLVSKECRHVAIHLYSGLWTRNPVWSDKSQLPCSQWSRMHGLASSDVGFVTWEPVWSGHGLIGIISVKLQIACCFSVVKRWQNVALQASTSYMGLRTGTPCEVIN